MRRYLKLKALFLLSVVSLITLQNAVPHIHHSHDDLDTVVRASSEHHEHHDDDHLEEKNISVHELTFLHQLIENHSHSSHSHELAQLNGADTRHINVAVFYIDAISSIEIWPEKLATQVWAGHKDGRTLSPHSSGLTLRGPPFLFIS
uniref:hypothetical protein n=1 Tax=Roseivirga sp. TaxID=1964215 RepID=UPI0040486191